MASSTPMLYGEFSRTLDERFRLALPLELADGLIQLITNSKASSVSSKASNASESKSESKSKGESTQDCILVKESAGCLSLWPRESWIERTQTGLDLVHAKLKAGKLSDRWAEIQRLGRLLSTRHREIQLAGRGRLVIPEGYREFLQVEPGGTVMVVGAAICIELWNPKAWLEHLHGSLPEFQKLFDDLTR
jgi:MraZ protein